MRGVLYILSYIANKAKYKCVDPYSGRYYTVGDNGAEMVNLKRGSIIFNHVQTKNLLKNGHITSRGRSYASGSAFAEGNAHVTIYPTGSSKNQWEGTGYSGPDDPTYSLSDALSNIKNAKDAADEFADTIDWVEIRLEEINEQLDLMSAKLENAASVSSKNSIIDQMIGVNENKMNNLTAGIKKYSDYAARLLADVPAKYRDAAQNGAISISEFAGEADEKTVEAINNYREWAQKVADLKQQLEETKTEIRDLAIQKYDNIQNAGDVLATIENSQTEKLQNAVDYDETRGLITDPRYYAAMMENSKYKVTELTKTRNDMQKQFDKMVRDGDLVRWTPRWFEELDKLYQIDAEIDEATIELEEFQNAINDIYWESFDQLIDQYDYISDETKGLIDLMSSDDLFTKPDNEKGWDADDVKWTKEGLATLGLHAQEMERAEAKAKDYAKAIDDLTAEYKAGHYSQSEYNEKLNELTQGQYEAIEAAQEEKEAIVELQEARIEEVKKGIEKQIDAYEELIDKRKEELDAEKDLYDFQKSTMEQQKNIADIQRRIAALSSDNSASAVAKRKELEAQLAEARAEQEDLFYNRSVEDRQSALDRELESFKEEKDAEMEALDKYLEDVEQVVTDSLNIVQANAKEIGQTLTDQTKEYNLTVSSAVLDPWRDGASAIDDYTTKFGDTVSSTTTQLNEIKTKWYEIRTEMAAANAEADKYYNAGTASGSSVGDINKENQNYIKAKKEEPKKTTTTKPATTTSKPANKTQTQKTIKVGGKINAGNAKIYASAGAKKGSTQYYAKDPIYVVLAEQGGYLKVRHHKSSKGVTGWFKKSDVKAYAKGSKGVNKNQLALIDELGEELQLIPGQNGRLEYVKKGTGIVPADLTERLMDLAMNPQEVLDRSRPQITPSKSVVNNSTEIHVDASVGELIHVETLNGNNLDEVSKFVDKAWDKKMQILNNSIRRFSR